MNLFFKILFSFPVFLQRPRLRIELRECLCPGPRRIEAPGPHTILGEESKSNSRGKRAALIAIVLLFFFLPAGTQEIHQAAKEGNLSKVKELVAADPQLVDSKDENGRTPLIWACLSDGLEIVKFLTDSGADVSSLDFMGLNALYYSIWKGRTYEIEEILVHRGADVNFNKGKSLLFLAAQQGKERTAELLLKKNAAPNLQNSVGKTALHIAAEYNRPSIVAALLASHADVTIKDNFARTPMHQVAIEGYGKIAELLLSAGSDVNAQDHFGKTPFFYAEKHGHKKLAGFLKANGGLTDTHEKNFRHFPELAKKLDKKEAVIWYLGHSGWAVKTRSKLLIFDYWGRGRPDEPRLTNGRIDPEEIKDLAVTVFVSHCHDDHYDETIFDWSRTIKKITYVFGWKNEKAGHAICMGPREKKLIDDMEVVLVNSPEADSLDSAFLVKTDGLAIYHAGDYGPLGGMNQITDVYDRDIGFLKSQAPKLDMMFLAGRLINNKIPAYIPFTIRTAAPSQFFLMHQEAMEFNLKELADELAKGKWDSKIIAPLDRGQVYFYMNNETTKKRECEHGNKQGK